VGDGGDTQLLAMGERKLWLICVVGFVFFQIFFLCPNFSKLCKALHSVEKNAMILTYIFQ